jgi:hypothetical protein
MILLFVPTCLLAQQDFDSAGKPGKEHERLMALVGKWELTVEGSPVKGTAEFKSILGGRFVTEEVKVPFGGPVNFEWLGIYGYDKKLKKYTAAWVDNMDTSTETGVGDVEGKLISFKGKHLDPRTNKEESFIWKHGLDGDKLIVEMYEVDAKGKETKGFAMRGEKAK